MLKKSMFIKPQITLEGGAEAQGEAQAKGAELMKACPAYREIAVTQMDAMAEVEAEHEQ